MGMNITSNQDHKVLMQTHNSHINGVLYKLDFPNGKSYIGITKHTADIRFKKHCSVNSAQLAIHRAINKYGKDNIKVNTLVIGSMDYLMELEKTAIKSFDTKYPHGYNLTDGGEGTFGVVRNSECRRRMSESKKGTKLSEANRLALIKANTGRVKTPEEIEKLKIAHTGRVFSKEHRNNLSIAKTGKRHTEEAKNKVRLANIGKVVSQETKDKLRIAALLRWKKIKDLSNA